MPRTRIHRKKGKGILSEILGGVGDALRAGTKAVGLGKRKRRRTKHRMGKGNILDLLKGITGLGKRRPSGKRMAPRRRTKHRGAGLDLNSGFLGKLNKIARESQVLSKGLNEFGYDNLAAGANALGYGRRRRRRGGMAHSIMPTHNYHLGGSNLMF